MSVDRLPVSLSFKLKLSSACRHTRPSRFLMGPHIVCSCFVLLEISPPPLSASGSNMSHMPHSSVCGWLAAAPRPCRCHICYLYSILVALFIKEAPPLQFLLVFQTNIWTVTCKCWKPFGMLATLRGFCFFRLIWRFGLKLLCEWRGTRRRLHLCYFIGCTASEGLDL